MISLTYLLISSLNRVLWESSSWYFAYSFIISLLSELGGWGTIILFFSFYLSSFKTYLRNTNSFYIAERPFLNFEIKAYL